MSELQGVLTKRPKPVATKVIKAFIATRCQVKAAVLEHNRERHFIAEYVRGYVNKWLKISSDYCPPHARVEVDYLVPDILPESVAQLKHRLLQKSCFLILPALPCGEAEKSWLNILNVPADNQHDAEEGKPTVVFFLSDSMPDPPPETPSHWQICRGIDELLITTKKVLSSLSATA